MKPQSQSLLLIFLEEAKDLADAIATLTQQWHSDLQKKDSLVEIKRNLHTLKGGSRMVNQTELSTLAHELESLCETILIDENEKNNRNYYDLFCQGQDQMVTIIDALCAGPPVEKIEKKHNDSPNDLMRVRADLLEKLNELSIENNIMRLNLSHHVARFNAQVLEMIHITKSLQEKMRLIPKDADFRITSEIMSLINLCKGLTQLHVNIEGLLSLQSRVELELQDRLVDTRMIPFSHILPRLAHIARQVAAELNKKIDFTVAQAEGEIDRNLLEHMIPSLEHLLRNAIDHGIETPIVRSQLKKPELGKIEVRFFRQGNEACIAMSDDGAGLNLEAIRKKALTLGLISENAHLSEESISRFIFEPGFSTREVVNQISGRGLGMDIVNTVVKGFGGNISIESKKSLGTKFTIRLPFTTSMNRALLVMVQEQTYGILLSHVERVVLLNVKQIKESLNQASPFFYFENKEYHLRYLGSILGLREKPIFFGQKETLPILLFDFADYKAALLVDSLSGSQEVVVQTLGPQFKLIDAFGGATLLADGRVVLILDVYSMMMKGVNKSIEDAPVKSLERPVPMIMVVDDSITVRTVTKNFLERYRYKVVTAKDGVEALEKVQQLKPDLMLLDLEMPRADGFEVAEKLRDTPEFSKIPIIMITFCVGDKQRAKAKELQIDCFIKKPYQEPELLDIIQNLLEKNKGS